MVDDGDDTNDKPVASLSSSWYKRTKVSSSSDDDESFFEPGDHISRWTRLGIYPIQVHGIVLSVGPDQQVTLVDFGRTSSSSSSSREESSGSSSSSGSVENTTKEDDEDAIVREWKRRQPKDSRRFTVTTISSSEELKQWKTVHYDTNGRNHGRLQTIMSSWWRTKPHARTEEEEYTSERQSSSPLVQSPNNNNNNAQSTTSLLLTDRNLLSEEEEYQKKKKKKTLTTTTTNGNQNDDEETPSSSSVQQCTSLPEHQASSDDDSTQSSQQSVPGNDPARKEIGPSWWWLRWPTKKKSEESYAYDERPISMDAGTFDESHHPPDSSMDTSECCGTEDDGIEKPSTTTKRIGTDDDKVLNSSPPLEASSSEDEEASSSQRETNTVPKSDPAGVVLERVRFLFERENSNVNGVLPPYHLLFANSECIAVWCKTGRFSTLQASVFLHSAALSQAKSASCLALFCSSQTVTVMVPASGIWGWFGATTTAQVGLLTTQPWLIPVLAGYGIAAVGAPYLVLLQAKGKWEKATNQLNDAFWNWAGPNVFVEAIHQ